MTPREQVLTSEQVSDRLSRLDGWGGTTSSISKDYHVGYDTAIRIAEIGKAAIRTGAPAGYRYPMGPTAHLHDDAHSR